MSNRSNLLPTLTAVAVVSLSTVFLWRRVKRFVTGAITVTELYIYPVKSCGEVSLDTATPTLTGLEGDRICQVTDENGTYCTSRDKDKAKLFHVQADIWGSSLVLKSPNNPEPLQVSLEELQDAKPVKVDVLEAPEKLTLRDFGDAASKWLQEATGIPNCRLTGVGPEFVRSARVNPAQGDALPEQAAPMSLADEAPYLLTSTSSLEDLNKRLKARGKDPVDMRRFRPNLVISGLKPWQEDTLKKIRIAQTEFWVWQRCGRCIMTTIDRDTLERGPEPLATLSTFRERDQGMRNFGMHLIPVEDSVKEGATISVDDEVEILEYDEDRLAEWTKLYG